MKESIAIDYTYQLTSEDVVSQRNTELIAEVVPDITSTDDIVIDLTFVSVLNQFLEAVKDENEGKDNIATLLYILSILSSEYALALHIRDHDETCTECTEDEVAEQ